MTQGIGSNLASILNKAKSTCSNIFAASGSYSGSSQYVNSIFSLINDGENALNSGDEQKAQAITNMVQNLLSMFTSFSNERAKATQDVNKNSKKIDSTESGANETANDTKQSIEQILSAVDGNKATIQNALDDLKALSGDDGNGGELAAEKEKLQKVLDEIEAQQEIINDGGSNIDAKNAALDKIKELSGQITILVSGITNLQKSVESLNGVINENAQSIEESCENAANIFEGGSEKLKKYMQEAGQQVATNTAETAKGTAEEAAGSTLTTTGSSTSFIPIVGQTASAKAIQIGTELIAAGGIRISGAATNIATITTALGKMASSAGEFQGALGNVIGSATKANELIGQYNTILQPTITSIGSWSQVADANKTLEEEIEKADTKLNGKQTVSVTNWQTPQNKSEDDKRNKGFTQQNSNIFNFDRKQFGI